MCLLVYPKTEAQKNVLTSLFKEMNIDYEFDTFELSPELAAELQRRLDDLKQNPERGISYEQIKQKLKKTTPNE